VLAFAPIAMWIEIRAIETLLALYRHRRDPLLIAIVPLGVVSVAAYGLCGILLLVAVPAVLHRLI